VFVTPLQADREIRAAAQVGFNVTQKPSLRSGHGSGPAGHRRGVDSEAC
jgi:hypothetical protein